MISLTVAVIIGNKNNNKEDKKKALPGLGWDRTSGSTKQYESKEPMSPAKIQEHEQTAIKREMTEKLGESRSVPERTKEIEVVWQKELLMPLKQVMNMKGAAGAKK